MVLFFVYMFNDNGMFYRKLDVIMNRFNLTLAGVFWVFAAGFALASYMFLKVNGCITW